MRSFILPLLQVCSLIAYICVELEACTGWATTYGYFKFISIAAMVTTLVLWVLLLFKVPQRILRCDCVRWPFPVIKYSCMSVVTKPVLKDVYTSDIFNVPRADMY